MASNSDTNQGGQGGQPQGSRSSQGAQPQQRGQQRAVSNQAEAEAAKIGILVFAVIGFGAFILEALANLLGDQQATFFSGPGSDGLYFAVSNSIGFLVAISVLVAVGLAIYLHRSHDHTDPAQKTAAIASGAGLTVVMCVLLILGIIFEPNGVSLNLGDEIPGLLGVVLGSMIVAAIAGYVVEEDPLDVLAS